MRISDWSSDVCSSDLRRGNDGRCPHCCDRRKYSRCYCRFHLHNLPEQYVIISAASVRSEAHTSELQSLMRTSYAVFCLKKTTTTYTHTFLHNHFHELYPLYSVITKTTYSNIQ